MPSSDPVVHFLKQLIDGHQPLLAVGVATEDGVIPALHADRAIDVVANAQPSAGYELEEHLLVRRARQTPIRKRNRVGFLAPICRASSSLTRRRFLLQE